jgi:hypothetical protein
MTEYNLTWEEAKEAMKRGAVVDTAERIKHKILNGQLMGEFCYHDERNWRGTTDKESWYEDSKWRIVEFTDCEIINKHFTLDCTKHGGYAFKFMDEYSPELKRHCIQKFTEQLKQDIKAAKEFKICHDYYLKLEEQKMQEPEMYSFDKAMHAMTNGKILKDTLYGDIYRYHNGIFQVHCTTPDCLCFWNNIGIDGSFMLLRFIEVENPEKKEPEIKYNELSMKEYKEGEIAPSFYSFYCHSGNSKINFDSIEKADKFAKALDTFIRLKAHPLAVKPDFEDDEEQFYIGVNLCGGTAVSVSSDYAPDKPDYLSPMFDSEEDADKAIKDIGEDNLVEMFKTFSGLYE